MGLGGIVFRDPRRPVDPALLRSLAAVMPGTAGAASIVTVPGALLFGGAPAPERHGSLVVAGDIDLTNLDELLATTAAGTPSAAVAQLWESHGTEAARRLRGGFALAVWDGRAGRLALAVDHFGLRRLFYVETPEVLAFATQPTALLAVPGVERAVDPTAIYHYLNFGYVPAPWSPFRGIRRLAPGHALRADAGGITVEPYWDLSYDERRVALAESAERLRHLTAEAVRASLGGTLPKETGAFLSGGTDSSTVVGLAGAATGERVNAFSIGFDDPRYDEMAYADIAARHFDATHYTRTVTAGEALAALPELVQAYDEPFGNNSAIGTLFCARLARECGIRTLLAGDGGDEIFGGNERYRVDRIFARYQLIPGALRRGLLEPLLRALPDGGSSPVGKAQRYVRRASIPNPRRFYSYEFFFAQEGRPLLDEGFVAAAGAEAPWRLLEDHYRRVHARSDLNRLLYLDLKLTIGDSDLLKVTRTAELGGVRVRFPLLHPPLVEFCATLPARFKVRGVEKRYLFKRAFRTLLPPATLAKQKHGFGVPTSAWLRSDAGFRELARDTLRSERARGRGYFRPQALDRLMELHAADATPFYGDTLWTVLMLELWQRRHVDGGAR